MDKTIFYPFLVLARCDQGLRYTIFLLIRAPSLIVAPPSWITFNPFRNKAWFLRCCSTSLLKTLWEKEKLLVMLITSNFSFSHSVFYPFVKPFAIFIKSKIVVCKLFSVWKNLKSVVRERVKSWSPNEHFLFLNNSIWRIWWIFPQFDQYFVLTCSHTMTPFDAPGKQAFWKHCGKRRNWL